MVNFNPIDKDYIVRWQSDLENTKERLLHKPSQDQSKSTALGCLKFCGTVHYGQQWIDAYSQPLHLPAERAEMSLSVSDSAIILPEPRFSLARRTETQNKLMFHMREELLLLDYSKIGL